MLGETLLVARLKVDHASRATRLKHTARFLSLILIKSSLTQVTAQDLISGLTAASACDERTQSRSAQLGYLIWMQARAQAVDGHVAVVAKHL